MTARRPLAVLLPRAAAIVALLFAAGAAAPRAPDLLSGLAWRNIGPFRGGRISAATGVIGEVGTFYVGLPNGGIWKTTSAGETWYPIFDSYTGVSSIGAVVVAPSDKNVVYAGAGDQFSTGYYDPANGVYKSTDAGKSWTHLGLDSTTVIPSMLVDPRDANTVLVGALGQLFTKGGGRGVYRSTDGGASWTRTLNVADTVGVSALASAYDRPEVIFATTRRYFAVTPAPTGVVPPGPPFDPKAPPAGGLFKSTDGGVTWKELSGNGLPKYSRRVSLAVAMGTNAQRIYLATNTSFHRSDDGGLTWRAMAAGDPRVRNGQGGYNSGVLVDPSNPDIVIVFNTSSYISHDGGATFTGFKGAPGGDDPQQGWIDPTNRDRILLGYDQGAIVSLDRGRTWSSWYNQSTEQVYHVAADNSFPYWVYATQQDAGAVRTRSRGDEGQIGPLDWGPVNGWEWGTIFPDPLDNNTVYSSGYGLYKIRMPSGQWNSVSPWPAAELRLRTTTAQPIVFAPWDKHELMVGFQRVFATTDGGAHWRPLSGDLTYPAGVTPPPDTATPAPNAPRPGAIEAIAPSPVAKGLIWVGTSNGLIKLTRDHGKTWSDASITSLPFVARARIEVVEASPTDAGTAYATVDLSNAGDYSAHIYRTRDYGKSWQLIVNGLRNGTPGASVVHVVRADPKRAGLLFAGSERTVYVSLNDGDDWQSLQLNLPTTVITDLAFAGNDLIMGSYGRGIWILDDYAVLRQITPDVAREAVHFFTPSAAVRVRRNVGFNTPLPPEVPHALNPPDGAILYYWLAAKPAGEVTVDVLDAGGTVIRHLSSVAPPPAKEAARPKLVNDWVGPPEHLPANAGLNRANWDIRYDPPPASIHTYEINANPGLTPTSPAGILAPPGSYTLKLTVNGQSYTRTVTVTNDPRSTATAADLKAQQALQLKIVAAIRASYDAYQQLDAMRASVDSLAPKDSTSPLVKPITAFMAQLDSIGGAAGDERGFPFPDGSNPGTDLFALQERFIDQLQTQESGDLAPTEPALMEFASACKDLTKGLARWTSMNAAPVAALNAELGRAGAKSITPATGVAAPGC